MIPLPSAAIFVLAGESLPPADSPTAWLINYGVAGAVIMLLVFGQLRTKAEVTGLKEVISEQAAGLKEKEKAIRDLTAAVTSVMPALSNVSAVVEALPQTTERKLVDELAQLTARLEKLQNKVSP